MTASARPLAERMFFIVGRGRSGTTLFVRMLDAHPEISVAPESLFVMYLQGRYARADWNDPAVVCRFARDLWKEERMLRWGLDPEALEERLLAVESPTFASLCAEVYRANAAARGRPEPALLGDKNPHYALFVNELAETFPAARFIHLTRHYPGNIASYRNVRFDLSSVPALAERWRIYHREILRAEECHPERFLRLTYESLLREPRARLDEVCAFLGVEPAPEMLETPPADDDVPEWHRNVLRPPDPEASDRWRELLTPAQVDEADSICQPFAAALGYRAETAVGGRPRWSSLPGRWMAHILTGLERAAFKVPLSLRSPIIRSYRRFTGNVIS